MKRAAHLIVLTIIAGGFIVWFSRTTINEYRNSPLGDAIYYTLMAKHAFDRQNLSQPIPKIYAARILPPLLTASIERIGYGQNEERRYQRIQSIWSAVNCVAFWIQVLFLFLLLRAYGSDVKTAYGLVLLYCMSFLTFRIYFAWPIMGDPLGHAFLLVASYCLVTGKRFLGYSSIFFGVFCKEILLLLLPAFVWKRWKEKANFFADLAITVAILLLWFGHRTFPYFPSELAVLGVNGPLPLRSSHFLSDYFAIFETSWKYLPETYFRPVFILIGTFFPLTVILAFHFWSAVRLITQTYSYWVPYTVACGLVGLTRDRNFFYIFPPVFIVCSQILSGVPREDRKILWLWLLFSSFVANEVPFSLLNEALIHKHLVREGWNFQLPLMVGWQRNLWTLFAGLSGVMVFLSRVKRPKPILYRFVLSSVAFAVMACSSHYLLKSFEQRKAMRINAKLPAPLVNLDFGKMDSSLPQVMEQPYGLVGILNGKDKFVEQAIDLSSLDTLVIVLLVKPDKNSGKEIQTILDIGHSGSGGFSIQSTELDPNDFHLLVSGSDLALKLEPDRWQSIKIELNLKLAVVFAMVDNRIAGFAFVSPTKLPKAPLVVGRFNKGQNRYFSGAISRISIWDVPLKGNDLAYVVPPQQLN